VTQETGFSDLLPVGAGLFAVRDSGEAADALEQIENDYARHAAAARKVAEDYFDSRNVLTQLLENL
jgi:hypothetical protein